MPILPPMPPDEAGRLAQLRALMVLDSAPEPLFDNIARLASEVCGVPIALMSLIDAERQWFKANVGLPGVNETPRDVAFCAHAIASDALFAVPDTQADARFSSNPLVTGQPLIRFYAGVPLVVEAGQRVGTLCVIDRQPRELSTAQQQMLKSLAGIASKALEMRRDLITRALVVRSDYEQALADSEERYRAIVEDQAELVSLARAGGELVYANRAYARHFGRTPAQIIGTNLFDYIAPADRNPVAWQLQQLLSTGLSVANENRMIAADGAERWVSWTNTLQQAPQGEKLVHSVGRDITERHRAEQALRASQRFLLRTGQVAGVGGWQLDLATGAITWSDETRRIHEVPPGYVPTLESAIAFYEPEARRTIEQAVALGMAQGQPWDLELPFVTATGRPLWVRAVGEVEFENGQAVRLVGAFQDITGRKQLEQRVADNERFLRQITDNLPLRIAYVDPECRYRFANLAHCKRFGLPREQIIGRSRSELTGGASDAVVMPHVQAALAGQPQRFEYEERVGGSLRRIDSQLVPDIADDGQVRGFFATGTDITAAAEARAQLQRQTAALRAVIEAIPAIVAVVGADGRYRFVNSAFERWIQRPREQVIGHSLQAVLGAATYEVSRPWIERALGGESASFERDHVAAGRVLHLALSYIPMWLDDGVLDGFIGVAQDITQHKQEEVRLLQLSQRDALTGLINRAGFEAYMERQLNDGSGAALALLYIDLDHFKPVNDRHGHPVGDQVLRQFAQRLQKLVRPTDAVARLGGDEFAIALAGVRLGVHAQAVADKVIDAARQPFQVGALQLHIGASVGVSFGADPETGWGDLVERADAQLYEAKAGGRGRQAGAEGGRS